MQSAPQMQLPAQLQETSLRPPPPPPVLPPAPHHSVSGAAAGPEAFVAAAAQQGAAHQQPQQAHQQQQLSHQGQYGTYANYIEDQQRNYMGYQNGGMQGMSSPWTASEGGNHNAMREATTISINDQMPGHVGMKILFEAPPLLHDGFNAKYVVSCLKGSHHGRRAQTFQCRNGIPSSIGREFGELCRTTHNTFQHESPDQVAVELDMSQTQANAWGQQQWDWSSWGQGHGDQMGHSSVGGYGGHAGMGHSVLSTQGDGGMYTTG